MRAPLYSDGLWATILRAVAERPMQAQHIRDSLMRPDEPRKRQRLRLWRAIRDLRGCGWLVSTPTGLIATTEALAQLADAEPAPQRETA